MREETAELRPGDRVTYRGMRGLVLDYGWYRHGEWHHGPLAPVLCQDSVTRMLRPADVAPLDDDPR